MYGIAQDLANSNARAIPIYVQIDAYEISNDNIAVFFGYLKAIFPIQA